MRSLGLVALTGCGRLAFDTAACELAVGHDEDRDGIDDACDVCPHVADATQPDRDGDIVGDACDPNPTIPTERITFFDPFTSVRSEWKWGTRQATYSDDAITQDVSFELMFAEHYAPLQNGLYLIAGRFAPAAGPDARKYGIIVYRDPGMNAAAYYCELNDVNTGQFILGYTPDHMTYSTLDFSPAVEPIEGAFVLTLLQALPATSCTTSWAADQQLIEGVIPGPFTPLRVAFLMRGGFVTLDYFVQIQTDS